ncbi:MAG: hypothetical protein KBB55_04130, partial [Candidatus Buchananbacteria bacterium]|nr:hypothetical protein [Candidatus Buchananbacteria bacterium]
TCRQYGVNRIATDGSLTGWAWNGAGSPFIEGAGWVKLHGGGAQIVYPWLETGLGSIYVPRDRDVRQRIDTPAKNATYCIFARDVASFDSANCPLPVRDVEIGFPTTQSGVYRNALGRIDVTGLIQTIGATNRNKYGQRVVALTGTLPSSVTLADQVYHAPGNLTVSAVTFENGTSGKSGAGTIIVDGDLIINGNTTYAAATLGNSRELASVAWIVKGDIIIDGSVTNTVGAFVAFGAGTACEATGDAQFPTYTPNHCGVFFSVPAGSTSNQQLRVTGLVIAHAFDFRRTYADPLIGAEAIIYDGRLIANPPPGLKGFTEGLPVIRDF